MNTKHSLTVKLDKICSLIIRQRGKCECCGLEDYSKLQCCHIYTRKWKSVRWDFLNLLCLCASCHSKFHDKPIEFAEFVRDYLGEKYEILRERANTIKKWTLPGMVELFEEYELIIKYEP